MKINSNIQAMIANNVLKRNETAFSRSTEKLSSGYRINSAKDAPAGMAITNRMSAQLRSLNKANQNSANAVSAIQTAEGALSEIQDMVQRMNELATKAANGTNTTADREAIQAEEIMEFVRDDVLKEIETSEIGISGANALAAEEGSLVLVHNEGNISLVSSKKLHILRLLEVRMIHKRNIRNLKGQASSCFQMHLILLH